MKKLLILALALAPAVISAQTNPVNVNVTTSVRAAFTLTAVSALNFGVVETDVLPAIDVVAGTGTGTGSVFSRGNVTAAATTAAIIYTGLPASVTLTDLTPAVDSPATINVDLTYARGTTPELQSLSGGTITTTGGGANAQLWIGGEITTALTLAAGNDYTGTITVTATYL
jgi:hypothetical protein